jgi:hypothetical protein
MKNVALPILVATIAIVLCGFTTAPAPTPGPLLSTSVVIRINDRCNCWLLHAGRDIAGRDIAGRCGHSRHDLALA